MKPEITWSNSSLTLLQNCAEAFRRRYLEREYTPPTPKMVRGTAIHKTAARTHHRQLHAQTLPSVEETRDTAATEFKHTWNEGVQLSAEEMAAGLQATRDGALDFAVDLSAFHVTQVAPAITPIGVERKIIVRPRNASIAINGVIDLIDRGPTGEQIRDLKTSEKTPFSDAADRSQQLTFYGLIRLAETGALPEHYALDYLVRTPVKHDTKHVVQQTVRDPEDIAALVERINAAVSAVEKGVFTPADASWWGCSKQWCPYYTSCKYVRRGERRTKSHNQGY